MFSKRLYNTIWKSTQHIPTACSPYVRTFATMASSEDYEAVMDLVKKRSIDYFYAGCMLPEPMKVPYFVAQGFNTEVAIIRDQINGNVLAGRMRLQWLRDQVTGYYEKKTTGPTPLLKCVFQLIDDFKWSYVFLDRMIEAREMDLNDEVIQSLEDLNNYGERVYGSIGYLIMQSFGIIDDQLVEGWRRVSHTMAVSTLLRGSPYHLQHDRSYFPVDLCDKYNIAQNQVFDIQLEGVKNVVRDMVDISLQNYEKAKAIWQKGCVGQNKQYQDMILLASPSIFYLEQLRKRKYNLVDKSLSSPFMNVKLQNRLLKQKKFHSY